MTTLDRYLLKRMVSALAKALVALVLLFVLIDLLTHRRDNIVKHDIPWYIVFEYYAAFTPQILCKFQIAALATLVSGLLVLGHTAQDNEVTAALAGGISLWRFLRMPILVGLGLAVSVFAMSETAGTFAARQAMRIEETYFAKSPLAARRGVSWANLSGGWTCHIDKFNRLALTGEDVVIYAFREDAHEQIEAGRIFWSPDQEEWLLEDGRWVVFEPDADLVRTHGRITQRPAPFSETPEELFALDRPPETKTAHRLAAEITKAERRGMPVGRLWVDYHAKFSQPALSFVMLWLAIPFAMRVRRGGLAISFGLSIAIALAYLALSGFGMLLGYAERLYPPVAAWLANGLFFAIGVTLFRRTPT